MHELAIAEAIVEKLKQRMVDGGYARINAVGLRIGKLSDVVPDALTFGFELCIKDTSLDGATLEIEHVPVRGRCNQCKQEFDVDGYLFQCISCNSRDVDMLQGQELELTYLRVEDEDD